MDFLLDAKDMYDTITADKSGNVWVTVYPVPGGKDSCLYAGEGEAGEVWQMVEKVIQNNLKYSKRFRIRVAMPVKEGASAKNAMAQTINVSYEPTAPNQVAGIGSIPGYGHADIGKLLDERDEKWKKELEHRDALRERDDKIAALEYDNRQKKKKGDFWEQAIVFCQETGVDPNPIINGIISKIPALFARGRAPMPGVAGLPNGGRRGNDIHRQTTDEPIPGETDLEEIEEQTEELDDNQIAMNESIYKELLFRNVRDERLLSLDYAKVIEAMIRLDVFLANAQAMGMAKDLVAADLLVKVSDFIIEKPMEAQKLVQQMKGDTNEAGA